MLSIPRPLGVGFVLCLGSLCLAVLGCRAPAPSSPATPKPGVPAIEMELLKSQYRLDERPCKRSAEEVVDLQRRCSKEHWADCLYAASMYYQGCGVAQSRPLAEQLNHRACTFGSMLGCEVEARFVTDQARALVLLEAPCARGSATACAHMGILLYERGREADVPRTARLLKVGCHDDDVVYCSHWGKLVLQWKLVEEYQDAQRHLQRACQAEDKDSCQVLASAYEEGLLGVTDPERALFLYGFSCSRAHPPSCEALGHMYARGRVREKDQPRVVELLYGFCARGDGLACNSLGEALEEDWGPANPAEALRFYQQACEVGHEAGCQRASELGAKQ